MVANVFVWDHARSAALIASDMIAVPASQAQGLVACWPLADGPGTTAHDVVGSYPGTIRSGAWQPATCLRLAGLSFAGPAQLAVMPGPTWTPQAFTVEWWLYPRSLLNYNQVIAGSDVWGAFAFHTTAAGAVYVGTDVGTRFTPADVPNGTVQLNTWQHFAFTFNHGNAVLYRNGQQLAAKSGMAPPAAWKGMHLGWAYPDAQIDGVCAEVRVWDHARTPAEFHGYMFSRLRGPVPGLVAYWPLDDGAGGVAHDMAGQYPGAIQGATWARPQVPGVPADVLDRSPVRLGGNCVLAMGGQDIFAGTVRIGADSFWFQGQAKLSAGVLKAVAQVNGLMNSEAFCVSGSASLALGPATLVNASATITRERVHVEGAWLGGTTVLDVVQQVEGLAAHGQASFRCGLHMDWVQRNVERMTSGGWLKLANSLHLDLDISGHLDVVVDGRGFQAVLNGVFLLNGQVCSLPAGLVNAPPVDIASLVQILKKQLANLDPLSYFTALCPDASSWLQGIASGAVGWTRSEYQQMGQALRYVYGKGTDGAAALLKSMNFEAVEVVQVLNNTFTQGANEAADALTKAKYPIDQCTGAISSVFHLSARDIAAALKYAGYHADQTALALRDVFNLGRNDLATALMGAEYGLDDVRGALTVWYNLDLTTQSLSYAGYAWNAIAGSVKNAGYDIDQIAQTIFQLPNATPSLVGSALAGLFNVGDITAAIGRLLKR
jgi:hypothetical protein